MATSRLRAHLRPCKCRIAQYTRTYLMRAAVHGTPQSRRMRATLSNKLHMIKQALLACHIDSYRPATADGRRVHCVQSVPEQHTPCDGEEGPAGSKEQVQKQRKSVTTWEREHSVHGAGLGVEGGQVSEPPRTLAMDFFYNGRSLEMKSFEPPRTLAMGGDGNGPYPHGDRKGRSSK